MTPRVTIAIPCYNAARWIGAAVQSALEQTWPEKEVIVVDDGSTDHSLQVLADFGEKIRVIPGGHRGGNHARNSAVLASTGEWIQFLDADDFLLPQKITRQFSEVNKTDADVIFSPVIFDQSGWRSVNQVDAKRDPQTLWLAWELPQTGGCLWRKSALSKIDYWNEETSCCQEFELYLRAIKGGLRFRFAPTANAAYRVWSEDTLCRKDPRKTIEVRTRLYQDFVNWLRERDSLTPQHLALAGRACFEMSRTIAKLDLAEAARYHDERSREHLIDVAGPAAPFSYRTAYHTFGFSFAEKLASTLRR